MTIRNFAMIFGAILLIVGIMGFIPAFIYMPIDSSGLSVHAGSGYLLGLFPVNFLHSLVHVLVGAWGLIAMREVNASKVYAYWMAGVFGVLTVMGLIPVLNTMFGLAPLFGHDVWLHALLALTAGYFAYYFQDKEYLARHI